MKSPLRVVFFGTPDFAVPSLEAVHAAGLTIPLVVTQPDRPVGRSGAPRRSAVADAAGALGLTVLKPETVRGNAELVERLRESAPDVFAVVAYGRILPPPLLGLPRLGGINLHASLLPRHRGASPVPAAILAGDPETGVATMQMDAGLDTGPILLERRTPVGETETAGELSSRLARMGAALLAETLWSAAEGSLAPRPQSGPATSSRPIRREDGAIDWSLGAAELSRRLRAFTPWPGLYTFLAGERVKILEAREAAPAGRTLEPGAFELEGDALVAGAGAGTALRVTRAQRAGRRPVLGAELARSAPPPWRFEAAPRGSPA